jgi:hypothetical protein
VDVIGRDHVIEHAQTEALSRFEEPMQIAASLARKPEKKLSLMTNAGKSKIKDLIIPLEISTQDDQRLQAPIIPVFNCSRKFSTSVEPF